MPAEGKTDIHSTYGDYCYKQLRHSFCHGWASGPTSWLSQYVLGVQVIEPGCKVLKIKPHLDDLQWVEGSWSPELFDKFEANQGYKLQEFLPELQDKGTTDLSRRVIADYRQTVFELHRDYIQAVKNWAGQNSVTFRNQTHGSPTNWLDVSIVCYEKIRNF